MFFIIRIIVHFLLFLRYRISVKGLDSVYAKGNKGILFLPNHPALIDPVILNLYLNKKFKPVPIADETQANKFLIRNLAKNLNVLTIPDMSTVGARGGEETKNVLNTAASILKNGGNLLLYPGGHLMRSKFEDLGANSGVYAILRNTPEARIVLVRTNGLWGSSFGHGHGKPLHMPGILLNAAKSILLNGILFSPRRNVSIDFFEPDDFPKTCDSNLINRYIENFYNEKAGPALYVPYTVWEKSGVRELPEPAEKKIEGDINKVPPATRRLVIEHLKEVSGMDSLNEDQRLAHDLGLDSLAISELIIWISQEFGFMQADTDSMITIADCLLAATGHAIASDKSMIKPVPAKWFKGKICDLPLTVPEGEKITDVFIRVFNASPSEVLTADQISGTKTCRQIITGITALKYLIKKLPGEQIGIMLPASAGTCTVYLAVLFSGKIPVMFNWTLGTRSLLHCLNLTQVSVILTSKILTANLELQNVSLDSIKDKFVFLEDLGAGLTRMQKIISFIKSYGKGRSLLKGKITDTAVILFTSGSENLPKAVPLTHNNLLANVRDVVNGLCLKKTDSLFGMLPPFHSFGLTGTLILPLCTGLKTVYHPNPTQSLFIARLIEAYRVSIIVGTPTFLNGIVRAADPAQLKSLNIAFSGAEKCPESVYEALQLSCPELKILEGYGITECSPVVSFNRPENAKPFTIGKVAESLDYAIVNLENSIRVSTGSQGMLLVRGPSVFKDYLKFSGSSPFVTFENRTWYKTGDLIKEDKDKILTFCGRLKRFVKLGGEMISLPAIEHVLLPYYSSEDDTSPVIAVEAVSHEDHPEIILFTTMTTDRNVVNRQIRESGLSPLHNIRKIIKVDSIPVLGTGKTDYRALKETKREF